MVKAAERVEIYIQEDMDVSQRAELTAKLEKESGIIDAWFKGGNHHHLTVNYEGDQFSHLTLLDTIKEYGFHGEIVVSEEV